MDNITEQEYINKIKSGEIEFSDLSSAEQTEEICVAAIEIDAEAIIKVNKQTKKICLAAVRKNPLILMHVEKQDDEICLEAVSRDPFALKYVKDKKYGICLEAVKNSHRYTGESVLLLVDDQTEELCLTAVKSNVSEFFNVKNQTNEICLAAVRRDGFLLLLVKEQTEEICLEALRRNSGVFNFVKNQTEKIHKEVLKYNPLDFFKYVDTNIYQYNKSEIELFFKIKNKDKYLSSQDLMKIYKNIIKILSKVSDDGLLEFFKDNEMTMINIGFDAHDDFIDLRTKVKILLDLNKNKDNCNIKPNKKKII